MVHIYPAVMGIDQEEIQKIELLKKISDRVHIDIMDNLFVPNVTHGTDLIKECSEKIGFFPWIHLMVQHPLAFYERMSLPNEALVSFHIESSVDVLRMIKTIKEKKHAASIAISPKTALVDVVPFAHGIDQVLVMSVDPGFSGQAFLPSVLPKIKELVKYREAHGLHFRIALDGGINENNIQVLALMGVDDFAVSSGIFGQKDPEGSLQELVYLVESE